MARNRKRAKDRRPRQGQPVPSRGNGQERRLADNGDERRRDELEPRVSDAGAAMFYDDSPGDGAADPIGQAAPDAEVAEARLAIASRLEPPALPEDELGENGQAVEEPLPLADAGDDYGPPGPPAPPEAAEPSGRAVPTPSSGSAVAAPRPWLGERLLGFLEGSWRELQRVQWPDRRQVMQATGVVIGFVIVAAALLGLADFVAPKIVHFVIYGN